MSGSCRNSQFHASACNARMLGILHTHPQTPHSTFKGIWEKLKHSIQARAIFSSTLLHPVSSTATVAEGLHHESHFHTWHLQELGPNMPKLNLKEHPRTSHVKDRNAPCKIAQHCHTLLVFSEFLTRPNSRTSQVHEFHRNARKADNYTR